MVANCVLCLLYPGAVFNAIAVYCILVAHYTRYVHLSLNNLSY